VGGTLETLYGPQDVSDVLVPDEITAGRTALVGRVLK
jgi:hypothetical protein